MPTARLTVSVPPGTWIHEASHANPETTFRVLAVAGGEGTGVALLDLRTADPVPIIAAIERAEEVVVLDLLAKREETTLVQVETTNPQLLVPVREAGIPLRTPFAVVDGRATWELTASTDRLSALGEGLEAAGIAFEIEAVRDDPAETADRLLTDRQREVLVAAAGAGYYDTPRGTTLTALAEELDVAKATASDVLHRAESSVLNWFIEEYVGRSGSPTEAPVGN